jgi:hypothetical protein
VCSQPRIRGLPMSTGFRRSGAEVVTQSGYGTVGYLEVVALVTPGTIIVNTGSARHRRG